MNIMKWFGSKMARDIGHYLLTYVLLLFAWWFMMGLGISDVVILSLLVFPIFIVGDKIVHKIMKV